MSAFKLSAQLSGHEQDVRAVKFPKPDTVLTTSRDNTVRLWRRISDSPPKFDGTIVTQGHEFINSLAYLPPFGEYPDGLVVSGARDGIIDVRLPTSDPSHDALRLLIGHSNNVCTLDTSPSGKYIVSGGWDGQARVWSVDKWETEVVLEGHGSGSTEGHKGVWAVLAYDENTAITGCADHMIRGYDLRQQKGAVVQPIITVQTPDIVRALCRLPAGHPSGADIASAGNDSVIRLWKMDGQQVAELHGHESFIYSLDCLPSGELVSAGEDRTVRIWKGRECIQTITHPAISVWSVAVCRETGDIVSGASDRMARVFTRSDDRVADPEMLRQFEESVKTSAIPQQQGSVNKEKLPGPEFLKSKTGTKEGQTVMIKEDNGSVSAYQWSQGEQQWVMIGTVVEAPGSSGRKVEYQGQMYDYVFDVDIEDGKPPLKLPYNMAENPYDRATKFLGDNNLPVSYLKSVANFIVQNTQGVTLGQNASQTAPDPYGTQNRYLPGQSSQQSAPSSAGLPNKEYVMLLQAKFPPIEKKIASLNSDLIKTGQKQFALNPQELNTLSGLADVITTATEKIPAVVTATAGQAPGQAFRVQEPAIALVLKLVSHWPYQNRLPGLDILRCLCASETVATYRDSQHGSILDVAISCATEAGTADSKLVENSIMMALRAVVNLFATEAGRSVAAAGVDTVVALMECVLGISDAPVGDLRGPVGANNRNVLVALTSAAINYGVLASAGRKGDDSGIGEPALALLLNVLGRVLTDQTDSEVVFRALVGLADIVSVPGDGDGAMVALAKSLGAEEWARTAQGKASEDRVKNLAGAVLRQLR